jgi:hypothetical protein
MLDEIYEYAQKVPDSGGGPPAPRTTPAPPTLPTLPSLQELFPWLPTLPTLAPPPTTPEITTTTLPEQGNSENGVISQNAILGEQQQDVATDFLDANELMRKFLKVMSKDASRVVKINSFHIIRLKN